MGDETEATGHSYDAVVTPPTCTEKGYTTYTCACGDSYVDSFVPATGYTEETIVLGQYVEGTSVPLNNGECANFGQRIDIGDDILKQIMIHHMSTNGDGNRNTWTVKIWQWNTDWLTTVATEPLFVLNGENHADGDDLIITIPYGYDISGDIYYQIDYTSEGYQFGDQHFRGFAGYSAVGDTDPRLLQTFQIGQDWSSRAHVASTIVVARGVCTHDYKAVVTPPTCTEAGYTTYTCTVCGHYYTADEVEALGHTEGEATAENSVDPDCVNSGSYDSAVYCTVCNAEVSRETVTVEALGHTEGEAAAENSVDPDCVNSGSYDSAVYCTVCNAEVSRETVTVEALGHNYETVVTEATKTEDGYTVYTCAVCGYSYVGDLVYATGSPNLGYTNNTDGITCKVKKGTCTDAEVIIPAYYNGYVVTAISNNGFYNNTTVTSVIILGDITSIGSGAFRGCTNLTSITIPASVTTISSMAFRDCSSLTDIYYAGTEAEWNAIEKTDGWDSNAGDYTIHFHYGHHEYQATVTPPTCDVDGFTTYTCYCGNSYTDHVVPALGHIPGAAADCENDQICTVCYEILTEKFGHTPGAEATCTSDQICTVCHKVLVEKFGHAWKVATCDIPKTCSRCSVTEGQALGHHYVSTVVAPTCTQGGYTKYTCSGCGRSYTDTPTAAAGHYYVGGICDNCGGTPEPRTITLAKYVYAQTPHNAVGSKKLGQRYDIGETYLKKIIVNQMATFCANTNSWTLKVWRWNSDYITTTSATPLYVTFGMNHVEPADFVVEIPDSIRIYGDIFYEIEYTDGTMTFTGWADNGIYQPGLESYLMGIKTENHYGAQFVVIDPGVFDPNPPVSGGSGSTIPDDPDVVVLADRGNSFTPLTSGSEFFGQRFDIESSTLKQLVITDLSTFGNNVNTWEIKFWQWNTNQPMTVKGTPIYTKTGSNHVDGTDLVIDIPDNVTLTGVIYYEIYYCSGTTGFVVWEALGSHDDSLRTYVNSNEVNAQIPSYIRVKGTVASDESWDISQDNLKDIMQNVFDGTVSLKETVMFIDKNTTKDLLFPINSVISVTSYDGKTTYVEGIDYVVENGRLRVTANSSIPCITSAVYYNYSGSLIHKDGKELFWGESQMKNWQVCVTYTHADNWSGFEQSSYLSVYEDFVRKLINGEDVTVMFYGDSITWGANASFTDGVMPKQGAYSMLFVEALADLFGYTVSYVNTGIVASMACHPVPTTDYVAGDRGTITYVNTAIGGWTSADGVTYFDKHIGSQVDLYGCDMFVVAFGMNDAGVSASTTKSNVKSIIDKMYQKNSNAAVMIVSTMTPHTGTDWDNNNIKNQESQLTSLASTYRNSGKAVAVAQMNSVSVAVQTRKAFNDYAGNNINHPNDWFYRVYAQTLLQTLIGYENIDELD